MPTRSGSSVTGLLLSQGLRRPNFIFEPMADLAEEMDGDERAEALTDATSDMREELARAFATGRPRKGSKFAYRGVRGASVAGGGDVIVKTIRLRYMHLRGWIEKQKSVKVRASDLSLLTYCAYCRLIKMTAQSQVPQPMQVIHLVRDPRGILSSMLKNSEAVFESSVKNFERFCALMRDDLSMSRNMPRSRYGTVKTATF